jgi:hypothetical protein
MRIELNTRIQRVEDGANFNNVDDWSLRGLKKTDPDVLKTAASRTNPNVNCMKAIYEKTERIESDKGISYNVFWTTVRNLLGAIDGCSNYFQPADNLSEFSFGTARSASFGILFPVIGKSLSVKDFVHLRASFLNPVELVYNVSNADGAMISPLKFAFHDIGHAEVIDRGNQQLCESKIKLGVKEWYFCARNIRPAHKDFVAELERLNSGFVWNFVFEYFHEFGLNPDLEGKNWQGRISRLFSGNAKAGEDLTKRCKESSLDKANLTQIVAEGGSDTSSDVWAASFEYIVLRTLEQK